MESMSDSLRAYQRKHLHVISSSPTAQPVEPEYTCHTCKDFGYVRANKPFGDPLFGKLLPCACTLASRKERYQQTLIGMSGIIRYSRYEHATFETFNRKLPGVKTAYGVAKTYADDPEGWLVLIGPKGCGKTHLAVAIAKTQLAQEDPVTVLIQVVPDLLDLLRKTFESDTNVSYSNLFDQMKEVDLLILDDYGSESMTPWAKEKLFQILNYRYNSMALTVITSNNVGLVGVDERIKSRLSDGQLVTTVEMSSAKDYRPNLKKVVDSQSGMEAN